MLALKKDVLKIFKELHKTRLKVFDGDTKALNAARDKINEEFKSNKSLTSIITIQEKVLYANDVDRELKASVVQAIETGPALKIRPETRKLDNKPFNTNVEIPRKGKRCSAECECYPP